jgi:hypothetical protein
MSLRDLLVDAVGQLDDVETTRRRSRRSLPAGRGPTEGDPNEDRRDECAGR